MTVTERSTVNRPAELRLGRHGNQYTMAVGQPGEKLAVSDPINVNLTKPVYVGIGVSSHDVNTVETAMASTAPIAADVSPHIRSKVSIYDLRDKSVHVSSACW